MEHIENNITNSSMDFTEPLQKILQRVDQLEQNYERRLEVMRNEHKRDVEEIVACYRKEKQQFLATTQKQAAELERIVPQLANLERVFKREEVEHKITKDALAFARAEIARLKEFSQNKQDLINMVEQRIETVNTHIQLEQEILSMATQTNLTTKREIQQKIAAKPASSYRDFFMRIFAKPDPKAVLEDRIEAKDQTFSY